MTAPSVLPHVDALQAVLAGAELTVYLGGAPPGIAPTDQSPYIVLYPDPGIPLVASLADDRVNFQGVVQLTCVGLTAEQALNVHDRAAAALTAVLSVSGRTSWKPEHLDGQPVHRDDDVSPPVFYAISRYRLRSIPQ